MTEQLPTRNQFKKGWMMISLEESALRLDQGKGTMCCTSVREPKLSAGAGGFTESSVPCRWAS